MKPAAYLVIICCSCVIGTIFSTPSDEWPAAETVYRAIDGVLSFFERNRNSLVLDVLAGIRVAEKQLNLTKKFLDNDDSWSSNISSMFDRVRALGELVFNVAKNASSRYFAKMGGVVVRPFYATSSLDRPVDVDSAWKSAHVPPEVMTTKMSYQSDRCLSAIANGCRIEDACWKTMTSYGVSGYALTHEVLYLILGHTFDGCFSKMKTLSQDDGVDIDRMETVLCSNVYLEMVEAYPRWIEPGMGEDLFMEQGMICSLLGFGDVLKPEWLHFMLRLQRNDTGCFGPSDGRHFHSGSANESRRTRRAEKELEHNCMVHMSSVGLGLLSVYLRRLLTLETPTTTGSPVSDDSNTLLWIIVYSIFGCLAVVVLTAVMVRPKVCFGRSKAKIVL